ncbi:hypothetical protein HF086_000259 [Spodoptera exigua]|uniref:YqaJ viral recombinase domain-containing protein n=2 Tax=Spodoptera exigua TaxID=7107 RepID=A0A922SBR6_SPOEX|nr:hypothetical protein HF086_000259 [Spodoptera exigua]
MLAVQNTVYYKNTPEDLNTKLIEGTMTAGCGNAQLERITASLDLPSISEHTYSACQNKICQAWETTAWDEMKTAGEREREAAINEGKVTKDGIALIDVIADGCWSKRSYKSNYAALSGAAAIVGRRFGQILFMSVKNKYCCICARSEKRNTTPRAHQCFKNYSGTSTAMESAILVEGFKQSVEMHNLIYARFIADGDSSTYAKILESRPYPDVTVEKINCRNHILRNFCNKLQQIKTDTKFNLNDRKKVTTAKILTARKYITDSITYHNKNRELDGIKSLHVDINQSMNHAFGKHGECNKNICSRENVSQECADFFNSYIFNKLRFITTNVSSHARSLIENVDSNVVERFNGVIAKFVGGKRINYSLKRSYQARCAGAVISFNTGKIHSAISKNIYKASPSRRLKTYEEKVDQRRRYHRTIKRRKNRALLPKKLDFNYGENVEAPDMDAETYQNCKTTFLKNLEKCDAERNEIQSRTILQSESGEWMELRRNLLTASNFGKIVKRKRTNSCANTVKNMLYKPDIGHVASINHGRTHEKVALEQLSKLLKVTIDPCGLYIDKTHPFLGATPDGIIENNTLVEIKCPVIPFKIGIEAAISQGKMHLWRINKKQGIS